MHKEYKVREDQNFKNFEVEIIFGHSIKLSIKIPSPQHKRSGDSRGQAQPK